MKQLFIIMLLISLSLGAKDINSTGKEKKKDGHETQKKQFVNFINDDGEYARNFVDLTTNEADGFDDLFRGRGNGGGVMGGSMQLTENSLGGLALDGESNMEPAYSQLTGNGFSSFKDEFGIGDQRTPPAALVPSPIVHVYPALRRRHHPHRRRYYICRANRDSPWLNLKCASSVNPDLYTGSDTPVGSETGGDNFGNNYNNQGFFGSFDLNQPNNQDILSPFYNSESKLEDNINLSDTISNSNQIDLSSFNEALQGLNHQGSINKFPSLHLEPAKGKAGGTADQFANDFGDLETSDDKLQKLLESSIGSNGEDANPGSATIGSFLSALLSQQGNGNGFHPQHMGQATQQDETANNGYEAQNQMQQNALNQLSGTISSNGMPIQTPVTVHVHASDKPGSHANTPPPPDESRAIAQQAQDVAMKAHKEKLARLKKRLALLRQKLSELEDEQSKKSSKEGDPKEQRKNAIKRILIKNLKVAAMIASREVQIEESKSRELESMSRKKNDDELTDDNSRAKLTPKLMFSKPVTELSKKAEDEVNHLTSLERTKHPQNSTLRRKSQFHRNESTGDPKTSIIKKPLANITVTLQNMSNSTLSLKSVTTSKKDEGVGTPSTGAITLKKEDEGATQVFLKKLRNQIYSMSDETHASKGKSK